MVADVSSTALDLVLALAVLQDRWMAPYLDDEGLTAPRADLLSAVARHGPISASALAERLGVTPRNITGLVDGLVGTGFVVRTPHPTDRRVVLVELSTGGAQVAAAIRARHAELAADMFGGLTDRHLEQLDHGLARALDRIRERLATA